MLLPEMVSLYSVAVINRKQWAPSLSHMLMEVSRFLRPFESSSVVVVTGVTVTKYLNNIMEKRLIVAQGCRALCHCAETETMMGQGGSHGSGQKAETEHLC